MNYRTDSYDVLAWRKRLRLTQRKAAEALGLSLAAYCQVEYNNQDRGGHPLRRTYRILCTLLEGAE